MCIRDRTCSSKEGVCATCYGRDLSRGKMVHVGEAIGMISAQSIGEPGTQLTMRTFHVGGTASVKQDSQIVSKNEGTLKILNSNILEDSKKNLIVMGRNTQLSIENENGVQVAVYKVAYGSKLFFKNGEKIKMNTKIINIVGWVLFLISAIGFIMSSIGNFWSMFGSCFFLAGCLVFFIPFFKKEENKKNKKHHCPQLKILTLTYPLF